MILKKLRERVCQANIDLVSHGLVVLTWGNVSACDRQQGWVAIKPSGVAYEQLKPHNIPVLDMDGHVIDGDWKPSSDTPTHLELYRQFPDIGGVCHTHSCYATMWAQACRSLPCLGTTHADHFYGSVPVTGGMSESEIHGEYERNTGKAIVKAFHQIDPNQMPAVFVAGHGPFTWGNGPEEAVQNAVVLEEIAKMAFGTVLLNATQSELDPALLDKHFLRKHGEDAYYGQE